MARPFSQNMIYLKSFFKAYRAPLLSGILFGSSFIPFPFFALFFALVPLWLFIYRQESLKGAIIGSFLCQFTATLVGFNWMIYTFHNFGGLNWALSFVFLLGFCAIANLYVALSGALWIILAKKSPFALPAPAKLILFPLIFSLLHSLIPTVFPWNMGYPWLWGGLPGAQTAELWGFRFLNTLFYVFNLLFLIAYKHSGFSNSGFSFWKSFKRLFIQAEGAGQAKLGSAQSAGPAFKPRQSFFLKIIKAPSGLLALFHRFFDKTGRKALAGALALFVGLNLLGFYLKWRLAPPDRSLSALVAQNNIGSISFMKDKNPQRASLRSLKTLTYRALSEYRKAGVKSSGISFILWPEGAYGYTVNKAQTRDPRLSKMAETVKIPLITGAMSKEGGRRANSLVALDREGNILKPIYDKVRLLIFGEYFPGIERFPFLRKMFPYFGLSLAPGKDYQTQELEGVRLGWQICYEALFDTISRRLANKGAQALVNVTNDSWYGSWQEPYQHLTMSFARAIETRRPLIRATNTGYSGVIRAGGSVDRISPLNKSWFYLYKVPYYKNPPKTLFMGWGYYINEMFLFVLAFLALAVLFKSRWAEGGLKARPLPQKF